MATSHVPPLDAGIPKECDVCGKAGEVLLRSAGVQNVLHTGDMGHSMNSLGITKPQDTLGWLSVVVIKIIYFMIGIAKSNYYHYICI